MYQPKRMGVSVVALESVTWRALVLAPPPGAARIEDLARQLGLPVVTIAGALAGLLSKGLVRRTAGSQYVALQPSEGTERDA